MTMAKLPDLILSDGIRAAVNHAFRVKGYVLKLGLVRERRTSFESSWVWGNRVHWNETAFELRANGDDRFWFGVCHECSHLLQWQVRGWWWYTRAVVQGVRLSLSLSRGERWAHDLIPMELEADLMATKTWKPMQDYYETNYGSLELA